MKCCLVRPACGAEDYFLSMSACTYSSVIIASQFILTDLHIAVTFSYKRFSVYKREYIN